MSNIDTAYEEFNNLRDQANKRQLTEYEQTRLQELSGQLYPYSMNKRGFEDRIIEK